MVHYRIFFVGIFYVSVFVGIAAPIFLGPKKAEKIKVNVERNDTRRPVGRDMDSPSGPIDSDR